MNINVLLTSNKQNKIDFCKEYFINEENIMKILRLDISMLQYVPEEFMTLELCRKASSISPYAFLYIPKKYREDKFILSNALSKYGRFLEYCSDNVKKNPYYIRLAVKSDWYAIRYADSNLLNDRDFCISILKFRPQTIKYFSSFWTDEKIMLPLCRVYGENKKYLNDELLAKYNEKYFKDNPYDAVKRMFPYHETETWEEGVARMALSKNGGMYMFYDEE